MAIAKTKSKAIRRCLGLGFQPDEARHGFLLELPSSSADSAWVMISEHRDWILEGDEWKAPPRSPEDPNLRVLLERKRWEEIAQPFWDEASRRLKNSGYAVPRKPSKGQVPLHASLGKELCVLCWSIESADTACIPEAVRNWEGLAPEERWWLYTMTAAATGQAQQKNIGWRKALRFALTENPLIKGEGISPRDRKQLLEHSQTSLF